MSSTARHLTAMEAQEKHLQIKKVKQLAASKILTWK